MENFKPKEIITESILNHIDSLKIGKYDNRIYQIYTLNHKQAFLALNLIFSGMYYSDAILHDTDKLVLYEVLPKSEASRIHKKYAPHHIANSRNSMDLEQCIIDYECARFTKPDKPLNAYDTIFKYFPNNYKKLEPTLIKLGINSSRNTDFDFTKWNHLNNDSIQYIINSNIIAINKLIQLVDKFGEEKAVEVYYMV